MSDCLFVCSSFSSILVLFMLSCLFFFSSRRRHTRCALVTGVQTCALPISDLPQALEVTASPWVLGVSGVLAIAEFFADKIPGVDSGWDLLHTLLRVPAGAFLAAATLSPDGDLGAGMLATEIGRAHV